MDKALQESEVFEPGAGEESEIEPNGPSTSLEEPKDVFKKAPAPRHLNDKLREFEISRFDHVGDDEYTRFGSEQIKITVFFRDENPAKFDIAKPAKVGNTISVDGKWGRFTLKGDITDSETKSVGLFTLHDTSNKQDSFIYYRAYRAKFKVREDRTRPAVAGSAFDRQLKSLRENTFGWVHNWSVLKGPAFYLVDIVRTVQDKNAAAKAAPLIRFKGESKETGDRDWGADLVKTKGDSDNATDVRLVGNSDESTQRVFAVTLKDPESVEENTVMVDMEEENPEVPPAAVDPANEPVEYVDDRFQPAAPAPGGPTEPAKPVVSSQSGAFLISDNSLPRTRRMLADYELNRSIPGVGAAIASYQNDSGKRTQLQKFFYHANAYRPVMEVTGSAYDVSPAYAYVTVIESAYFTGGEYKVERPRNRKTGRLLSSALGPFQLLEGTARGQGLRVTALWKDDRNHGDDDQDERGYFATSACGAANYMAKLVNLFSNSDTTLAILAYKEGEGGAAAAAYCTKTKNQSCINRINNGMSGAEYSRYMNYAKRYNYTYKEMDRASMAIPRRMRDYVRNKLAVYFIASDMRRYGFTQYTRSALPKHKTVKPPYPIQDPTCRSAVSSLNL